jgi:hypothetical protein
MVDLALVLVGFWLLFTVVHAELRRREVELGRAKHRTRTEEARERARALEVELEGLAGPPPRDPLLAGLPADPTGAQIAEVVSPRPVDPGPRLLSEVEKAARERPDLAATAIRRMIATERECETV